MASAVLAVSAPRPIVFDTAEPRREPVQPKPQREPPKQLTDDDHARIQAAADRRAKRNAKRVG